MYGRSYFKDAISRMYGKVIFKRFSKYLYQFKGKLEVLTDLSL